MFPTNSKGPASGSGSEASDERAPAAREPSLRRVYRLTKRYALVCAAIFGLQYLPPTGIFLLFLGGFLWIGVIVHIYVLHVSALAVGGAVSRWFLALPIAFYGAGLATGLYSDSMAADWKSKQAWAEIDGTVPSAVGHLAFLPWLPPHDPRLPDPGRAFRPEDLGFEMVLIPVYSKNREARIRRLVFHSDAPAGCPRTEGPMRELGGRCFREEAIEEPEAFLLVDIKANWIPEEPQPEHAWGSVLVKTTKVVLHEAGGTERLGVLRGALIRKNAYVLFPSAGCTLVSSGPDWSCSWQVLPRWRKEPVGFLAGTSRNSPDSAAILMSALRQARGQTP